MVRTIQDNGTYIRTTKYTYSNQTLTIIVTLFFFSLLLLLCRLKWLLLRFLIDGQTMFSKWLKIAFTLKLNFMSILLFLHSFDFGRHHGATNCPNETAFWFVRKPIDTASWLIYLYWPVLFLFITKSKKDKECNECMCAIAWMQTEKNDVVLWHTNEWRRKNQQKKKKSKQIYFIINDCVVCLFALLLLVLLLFFFLI